MRTIVLKGSEKEQNKNYDKVFAIIEKETFFGRVYSEKEYNVDKDYHIEIKCIPQDALEKIEKIKNVEIIL